MKRSWPLIPMLLLLALPAPAAYQVGDTVADFTLPGLDGQPIHLSDFSGQVILINFFATWCPPCNVEAPILEADFHQEYQDEGFTVLGISILEDPAVVRPWVQDHGLTYPIALADSWTFFTQFPDAGGIPYNAVLDRDGVLQLAHYGFDQEELTLLIEQLLEPGPVGTTGGSLDRIKTLFR